MKLKIRKIKSELDAVFAYKIDFQLKKYFYLFMKDLAFSAFEAPLSTKFQNLRNSFD